MIREVARADPRCGHFGKVTSGKPPNPLDSHISATSNSLSFSPRLPELADQANRRMHLLPCQLALPCQCMSRCNAVDACPLVTPCRCSKPCGAETGTQLESISSCVPVSTASPFPPHVPVSTATLPTSWQSGRGNLGRTKAETGDGQRPAASQVREGGDLHGRSAPGYTEEIWAENRATRGRHPSADPGAKTGEGGTMTPCLSLSGLVRNRKSTSLNPENSISR